MEDQEEWKYPQLVNNMACQKVEYDKPNEFEKLLLEIFDEVLNDKIITSQKFRENVIRARLAVREVQALRMKGKRPC